jgi:uroporphyrinogen-III synthase
MKILLTRPLAQSMELADILEAILITSSNALPSLPTFNKKLFIVGKNTAKKAKELGFSDITCAEDMKRLKPFIDGSKILYLSGENISDNLSEFTNIKRIIAYSGKKNIKMVANLIDFVLIDCPIKICLFFSLRTAEIFLDLISEYQLYSYCNNLVTISISKNIEQKLQNAHLFKANYFAEEPSLESLITEILKCKKQMI